MIHINEKGEMKMMGSTVDLMTDVTTILHGYYSMMKNDFGEEVANRLLALTGKVAIYEPWDIPDEKECAAEMKEIVRLIEERFGGEKRFI